MLPEASIERHQCTDESGTVFRIYLDECVDVEGCNGRTLKHGRHAAHYDVLDAVPIKDLENPTEAVCRHHDVPG